MCGIAGILSVIPRSSESVTGSLEAMQRALRHRGPDGDGLWAAAGGRAHFAHTRLAIFDPRASGRQPMTTPDGRHTIVFNGAVYNYRELRRELQHEGVGFQTDTDTEVLLHVVARDGVRGLDRLRGMFAFAVWDDHRQTAILARDRLGIKPLYYAQTDAGLFFASEVRAVVASGAIARDLDPIACAGYFRHGSVQEPRTLLKAIRSLEAGHVLEWHDGAVQTRQYWDFRFAADGDGADVVGETRRALLDSVALHLRADRPVAILLSGGVDSTALVALARASGCADLHTLSMTLPGAAIDEGSAARRSAELFGTRHHELPMTAEAGRTLFTDFLPSLDQPSIDGLNTFAVARGARALDLPVLLSGLGSDELFGGYPSFAGVPRLTALHRRVAWAGPAARLAGGVLATMAPGSRARRIGDMLTRPASLTNSYDTYRAIFTRGESRRLADYYGAGVAPVEDEPRDERDGSPLDAVSRLELTHYMRNQLLRDSDVMSMANGIELRVPFLDHVLVERLLRIPAATRLAGRKALLKHAVPELPVWVTAPDKKGFQFPLDRWVEQEWRDVLREDDLPRDVPLSTWSRRWCVVAFQAWRTRMEQSTREKLG